MIRRTIESLAVLACVLALGVVPAAHAQPQWFAGVGVGLSQVDHYELKPWTTDLDDRDTAYRAFGGRQFSRNFALSVGYADFGMLESAGSIPELPADFSDRLEASGTELSAIGLWPITERVELYGTASYLRWDQTVVSLVNGTPLHFEATGGAFGLGGGMNIRWRDDLAITLDARRYVNVGDREATGRENRRDLFTAGLTWRFGD